MRYIRREDQFPPYLPLPRFLLELDLSRTALLVYALLLDRSTLSQRNDWTDSGGRVFVIFTQEDLRRQLGRGRTQVSQALTELEKHQLIARRPQGWGKPPRVYVLLPELRASEQETAEESRAESQTCGPRESEHSMSGKPNVPCSETRTSHVRKPERSMFGKPGTNYLKNQTTSHQREKARPAGRWGDNIFARMLEELEEEGEP